MKTPDSHSPSRESRRVFLKKAATTTAVLAGGSAAGFLTPARSASGSQAVSIVVDADDSMSQQVPVCWAVEELTHTLAERGISAQARPSLREAPQGAECILVAGSTGKLARSALQEAGVAVPDSPEALALVRLQVGGRAVVLATGSDIRGQVYALLELADRVRSSVRPMMEISALKSIVQKPANRIRSVARLFASDVEDKPWFNDRTFWQRYLTELATQRFNRFSLMLGLGYDFPTDIRDAYFHFAYPFLVAPAGYDVRAAPLPATERDSNLEMLRFISEEAARRGLHFQLGLWTHAYQWVNSPNANYVIEGLTSATHGPYCRDALEALLRACPAISGLTFRIHGESGVAEGSYEFWKTVFEGVTGCGRRVEIDMHAKGMDAKMIDLALATGMPVTISPKFWAEHAGLGYMQGAIRPLEMPPKEEQDRGFFAMSNGSRRFLRYGYGDLLREDRQYGVLHRIWPGTQRLLLWADPEIASAYSRSGSFCGSSGVEWCEPLSFKGRKGSGLPGGRAAYANSAWETGGGDFEKYLYGYRVWGRRLYDPAGDPDDWRRWLRRRFGKGSPAMESALSQAGKILPLITTAHCPSAANNNYWPEMYTNMAIVDAKRPHPYGDTLTPKRFGAVSSLDPEFFARIDDFAESLCKGRLDAKYSPAWVAASLEQFAESAESALATAKRKAVDPRNLDLARMAADVAIMNGIGRFFAWKFRAGVLFSLYECSHYRPALVESLKAYRKARAAWAAFAEGARSVYRSDVTFGPGDFQRGHWLDRLPVMDADIADMEKVLQRADAAKDAAAVADPDAMRKAIFDVLQPPAEPRRPDLTGFHQPANSFRRGDPLLIEVSPEFGKLSVKWEKLILRYRRVNQAEVWQSKAMDSQGATFRALIPGSYTESPFPLQYYFEVHELAQIPWLFPGLKPGWHGQPYFVVRQG
jgi:hypothetical protein